MTEAVTKENTDLVKALHNAGNYYKLQLSPRCTIMSHVHISSYYFHCLSALSLCSATTMAPASTPTVTDVRIHCDHWTHSKDCQLAPGHQTVM